MESIANSTDLSSFETAKKYFTNLTGSWKSQIDSQAETNRKLRDLPLDLEELRGSGDLSQNETIIPVRVIAQSIDLEQPQYAAFLAQPKRAAVFRCKSNAQYDEKQLERDFTDAMRYEGWQDAYLKTIDGAQLHGWDAVEIEYSPARPGGVSINHIGHENLLFPLDARKLEAVPGFCVRKYMTALKLKSFVKKFGFDSAQVDKITANQDQNAVLHGTNFEVYKFFFKKNGAVQIAWISDKCDGWLKAPEKFWNGRTEKVAPDPLSLEDAMMGMPQPEPTSQRVYETEYPVKLLVYRLNEKEEITSQIGRAKMDDSVQEALTNMWTAGVNGTVKSSNVYASPTQPIDGSSKPSVLDLELEPDRVYSTPMSYFSPPGVDHNLIGLANAVLSNQQATQGQVNFAATNRKDSRKTATEIESSEKQQQNLNIIQTLQFSTWLRSVYRYSWDIIRNLAQAESIDFLRVQGASPNGQPVMMNDQQALAYEFIILPAGDIDVVEKNEKVNNIMTLWPMAQMFPMLQIAMLKEMIQTLFLEDAPAFIQALDQTMLPNQKEGVRQILDTLLQTPPEQMGELVQGMAPDLQNLIQNLATEPVQ